MMDPSPGGASPGRTARRLAAAGRPRRRRRGGHRGRARGHPALGHRARLPADRAAPGMVPRAPVGRSPAGRDPARAARAHRPRPEPVPHLGRDVGRLGGVRPDGGRLPGPRRSTRRRTSTAAREEAMSYAAYRLLNERYIKAVGGDVSLSEFADLMDALCYPVGRYHDRGRRARGGRQPDRRGDHRLREDRRLERGRRLCGDRLPAGQPAARGRRHPEPPWPTRTAGSRSGSST